MEGRVQELLSEIKNMKNVVEVLETENAKLRQQLILMYEMHEDNDTGSGCSPKRVTGRQNLVNLYNQGFHICNIYFGQLREGECLFCAAFLRRKQG
ncbi:initiation control protein YabA [Desulfallas thermosapovorans]|uniref:initiation control protein YabA n=1 Tax=Desulfallas thermosapovorans TaxID=58137 RepID=UPI003C12BA1F